MTSMAGGANAQTLPKASNTTTFHNLTQYYSIPPTRYCPQQFFIKTGSYKNSALVLKKQGHLCTFFSTQ